MVWICMHALFKKVVLTQPPIADTITCSEVCFHAERTEVSGKPLAQPMDLLRFCHRSTCCTINIVVLSQEFFAEHASGFAQRSLPINCIIVFVVFVHFYARRSNCGAREADDLEVCRRILNRACKKRSSLKFIAVSFLIAMTIFIAVSLIIAIL